MLVINKYGSNEQRGRQLGITASGKVFAFAALPDSKGGNSFYVESSSVLPINSWTHVAGVFDETYGKLRLFVNGRMEFEISLGAGTESGYGINIGKYIPSNDAFFNGEIDEVRISKKARISDELQPNQEHFAAFRENQTYFVQLQILNATAGVVDVENYLLNMQVDADKDRMNDEWEKSVGLNISINDSGFDNDNDGLSNYHEYQYFTNPLLADSDDGGEKDGSEIQAGRDPLDASDDNKPPVLDPIGNKTVDENAMLSFTLTGSDPDGDPVTFSAAGLPAFCYFSPSTLIVSCAPDYNAFETTPSTLVTFTVTDAKGASDSKNLLIMVNNVNRIPFLLPISNKTINEGSSLNFSLNASDPDGDKLTYSSSNLPPFCSLNSNTGYVFCAPDFSSADNYPSTIVTFRASDGKSYDSKLMSLIVKNVIPCQSSIKKNTTLDSDLICNGVDGLYIDSNSIFIDCNGYVIKNSNSVQSGTGILVRSNSSSIKNCNITNFDYGIILNKASKTAISNIVISNSRYAGISLNSGTSNTLKNITSKSNQNGLQVNGGGSNAILSSIFDSNKKYGAFFNSTSSIKMTGTHICTNTGKDVYVKDRTTTTGSINNTCNTPYKWNDDKKKGCTYLC